MHRNRPRRNLRLRFGLACRLFPGISLVSGTAQFIEFTGQFPAPRAQVLFLSAQFVQHRHQFLFGQAFERVRSLRTHLRGERESQDHEDNEHDDMQAAWECEKCLPRPRPQAPSTVRITMHAVPAGS